MRAPGGGAPLNHLDQVVDRILRGDTAAFHEIVDATSAQFVRLGARMLGNVADAEDVVQEAYVRAYRSLVAGQFDRRARVQTWLYRIVVNGVIDAKRKHGRDHVPRPAAESTLDGAASAEARVALAELAAWLDDLPQEQQTVVVLKAIEGMSSTEVAEIIGCTEAAVEQRLVRARATLRDRRGS